MRALFTGLLVLAAAFGFSAAATAAYPEKPIRLIVPFGAGGGSDSMARIFQKVIQEQDLLKGQPLVVVNVPGAGGMIGARQAKNSDPDGYTFLQVHVGLVTNEAMGTIDFGIDDFEPVAGAGGSHGIQVVMQDSPIDTLEDLVQKVREEPNTVTFGINIGGTNHTPGLLLEDAAGIEFRFVQIGGATANLAAIAGGHIQTTVFSLADYTRYKEEGLQPLAYYADERSPQLPELPTGKELGYDVQFSHQQWFFAPKGTPQDRIDVFAGALKAAMETEYVRAQFKDQYLEEVVLTGQEFRDRLARDAATLRRAYKDVRPPQEAKTE